MGLLITLFTASERESAFLGPPLKKKEELCGTRFIKKKAYILYKRLLGTSGVLPVQSKLRHSKFSQIEE
jgi:hypothetical protein